MRLRYSPRAVKDLDSIFQYLAERSPRGASNVMTAIFAAAEFIRRNPEAAPAVPRVPGVRAIVSRRYPFKLFFRILTDQDVVEIIHVRHGARRPWQDGQ